MGLAVRCGHGSCNWGLAVSAIRIIYPLIMKILRRDIYRLFLNNMIFLA